LAERGAQFVVCKGTVDRYRCQFIYSETEQYGTGMTSTTVSGDCVLILLQVQSDHERQLTDTSSRATQANTDAEYDGPLVI